MPITYGISAVFAEAARREGLDRMKAEKDRRQARFLIRALAEDPPDDLKDVHRYALSRGPGGASGSRRRWRL